jgi:hypothetical protein
MGICCFKIFGLNVNNCNLYFVNEQEYNAITINLEDAKLDESAMPQTLRIYDGEDEITLTVDSFDSTVVPDIYADMDAVKDALQTMINDCYCPCETAGV